MQLPLSWRIKRIDIKHWFWRRWLDLKHRALDGWDGWSWGVRYLYDASPALIARQGIAAGVLISAGLVVLHWLVPIIHALAWAYCLTLLAMAALKAFSNRRDR